VNKNDKYIQFRHGGFNAQHAPIEDVIKYLTVTLKKKWGDDEGITKAEK